MSEKQAKAQRANTNQVVAKITIIAQAGGGMHIEGIPLNPILAMEVMGIALNVMAQKIHESQEASKSNIVQLRSPLMGPDGRRLN